MKRFFLFSVLCSLFSASVALAGGMFGSSQSNSAPLASPTFTGTPTAPTAALNTSTTQIATTAFVRTQLAEEIITDSGVLGSNQANVTFSNIPQGYTHLRICSMARQTTGALGDIYAQLNGDTTAANYTRVYFGYGSSVSNGRITQAGLEAICASGTDAPAGEFSVANLSIYFYTGAGNKIGITQSHNYSSGLNWQLSSVEWANTSAITSIVVVSASGNILAGSRFILYGIH